MALAIFFSPLEPSWLRVGLTALVPVGAIVALFLVRPLWRVPALIVAAFVIVLGAWLAISPSHERNWQPDVATLPYAEIRGDRVTVHNVRNTDYRSETDFSMRLEDRELDLSKIRSLDLFLNGYLDELGYENGAFDNSLPFSELKARSHINARAQAADRDPRFSVRIRQGVPRMTESPET